MQLPDTATLPPQVFVVVNSLAFVPLNEIELTAKLADPVFDSVKLVGIDVVPEARLGKLTEVGDIPAMPVPKLL